MAENTNEEKTTSKFMLWLAVISTVLFFGYIFAITFVEVPDSNKQIENLVFGFVSGTLISSIYGYYFGSSASSKSKDKTIQAMTQTSDQDDTPMDTSPFDETSGFTPPMKG